VVLLGGEKSLFGASENSTQNAEGFGENGGAIVADGRSHE
jgi:hypothetical protein